MNVETFYEDFENYFRQLCDMYRWPDVEVACTVLGDNKIKLHTGVSDEIEASFIVSLGDDPFQVASNAFENYKTLILATHFEDT